MTHELHVWADERKLAVITYEAKDDHWALAYDVSWTADPHAFPLTPALPLSPVARPASASSSQTLKRFIEHLLPEGRALDVAVAYNGLTKTNLFGLIRALGVETAGALRFTTSADEAPPQDEAAQREIPLQELDARIAQHESVPLTVWDGKVRMSVAGQQDKLPVYIDRPLTQGGRLLFVDGSRLASTHILKPDTGQARTPHLAVNEHFCMSLARRMGLPAAEVSLLRAPRPVLVVRRFDRQLQRAEGQVRVQRMHIIDACQACDLPVSFKYERNIGNAPEVRNIRDGVSFERLFGSTALTGDKAAARLTMLRWAMFQFLIGNSDAHGKNFSFFVRPGGLLEPAPWYDLVSVLRYDGLDSELAMAFGEVFEHDEVSAFALADFGSRCGIHRLLMRREGQRMAKLAATAAAQQLQAADYLVEERQFLEGVASFVAAQSKRLTTLVDDAVAIKAHYL